MAGRGLSVAQQNAMQSGHRITVPLIELFFDSGTLRVCAAPWDIVVGANTYAHASLRIKSWRESAGSTEGLELAMNGLDPAIIVLADTEQYQGRLGRLLKAYLQADSNQVIGTPVAHFVGRMRNIPTSEMNSSAQVAVVIEHFDKELARPNPLRWGDSDQQRLFPGDKGCEFSAQNSDKTVVWPSKKAVKYGNPQPLYR
jgi:hypothetical protein